jgi:peptidyl-prolyl cis-trans isomerase A (cyclophilin A)
MPRLSRSRPLRAGASVATLLVAALPVFVVACKDSAPPEPVSSPRTEPVATALGSGATTGSAHHRDRDRDHAGKAGPRPTPQKMKVAAKPVASVTPATDDPLKGVFTLADATKDIAGKGALVATIETDLGALQCELFEDKAPITVANFVGLATGKRPFKNPEKKWVKKPAYDGTIFHRIIKGFMIQGGDAAGNGAGEPGYVIPDEIWEDANHDRAGLLCMANRGPNTNGAQFFITDAAAAHLDRGYTIFGECAPVDTVHKIAGVEVKGEKPVSPPKIKKITFKRAPSPIAPAAASGSASASASAAPKAPPPAAPVE